jgi:AraC family transcriptional regulator of adaptative response / DNA-3-methyladenine glycosylase II
VCRGVRLILEGALDRETEEDLARRLGISARHLRRLFTVHLGVTPDGLARSARVHFARRLLDDTDLSVTEIAFAAGFGSLRQFNRACRDVFRESPRALRARRRKTDRLVADGGLPLRLSFVGPLDWSSMLEYFAAQAIPGVEHVAGETYRRTIVVDGHPGVLELSVGGSDYLTLCAHLPRWPELVHIVQRARRIANLELPLHDAESALARDPLVGPLLRNRRGLRPPGTWDAFETGVRAIVGENVTREHANKVTGRLVERFGVRVPGLEPLGLTHTFPQPSTLATADLRELGLGRGRATAISAFARAVAEDQIRLDRSVGLTELVSSITALGCVNEWTAQYIALRLGEPDAYPAAGVDVQQAERWRPWRALAATHLLLAGGERLQGAA